MKIVIGSESFKPNISGVSISTELLAQNLSEAGHKVYIFAPSPTKKTFYDKGFKDFNVIRVKSFPNPFRKGFRVAKRPLCDIKIEINKINPDIIHLQDPAAICGALRKIALKNNIPLVITNHFSLDYVISYLHWAKPIHPLIKKILAKYLSNFYNKTEAVFCPTETVKKDLRKWGVKTKIYAVSNGVDLNRFYSFSSPLTIHYKYHLPNNRIILYTGRIDKDKSIDVLIEAIPLITKLEDCHFVFVGSGDEMPKFKKIVEKLKLDRYVSFIGWVDHQSADFPELYQIANLFAIPSSIETQSIVTLEAMASGLPIVAANAGALPELVKNSVNGYLFKPTDKEDLAKKIVSILKDKKKSEKMGQESLKIVASHTISDSFKKVYSIYEEAISQNN